jgi:hypothetical protein
MGLTTNQLPYPEQTDSVDVVRDIKALGLAVDPQLVGTYASAADRASSFPSPQEGAVWWLEDTNTLQVWDGGKARTLLGPWTQCTFAAGHADAGAEYRAQYRIVDEWCELRGAINAAAGYSTALAGNNMLTGLPPSVSTNAAAYPMIGAALHQPSGTTWGNMWLSPRSTGALVGYPSIVMGANSVTTLDGVRYKVAVP